MTTNLKLMKRSVRPLRAVVRQRLRQAYHLNPTARASANRFLAAMRFVRRQPLLMAYWRRWLRTQLVATNQKTRRALRLLGKSPLWWRLQRATQRALSRMVLHVLVRNIKPKKAAARAARAQVQVPTWLRHQPAAVPPTKRVALQQAAHVWQAYRLKGYRGLAGFGLYVAILAQDSGHENVLGQIWGQLGERILSYDQEILKVRLQRALRGLKLTAYVKKERRRLGNKFWIIKAALRHITGMKPRLTGRKSAMRPGLLDNLRHLSEFRRWARARYFTTTVAALLHALMTGTAVIIGTWLRLLLNKARKHKLIFNLVKSAGRFFLDDPDSPGYISPYVVGQGFKVELRGKVDGKEIANDEKAQAGAVPTSTLSAGLVHEFAPTDTKYGVLGLHFWLYLLAWLSDYAGYLYAGFLDRSVYFNEQVKKARALARALAAPLAYEATPAKATPAPAWEAARISVARFATA